jgi:hybrid cluster-associated redox disulfide protein
VILVGGTRKTGTDTFLDQFDPSRGIILRTVNLKLRGDKKMAEKKFNKDMVIGDILEANPGAIKVIEKYFGQGCFTCPGMQMESISFGAMMHNIDPEVIVKELNELE